MCLCGHTCVSVCVNVCRLRDLLSRVLLFSIHNPYYLKGAINTCMLDVDT